MKKIHKKLGALVLASLMCVPSMPIFAANQSYSFSLKTTSSVRGTSATKDDDDLKAYLKVSKMSENVATNFRVRNSSDGEATYMQTVSAPSSDTYHLQYRGGHNYLKGKKYYLWANLVDKQSSTVTISGTWCP